MLPKGYFGIYGVMLEHIYVYTNRLVKGVYLLRVHIIHQGEPVPRIWIVTRGGVHTTMYRIIYIRVHTHPAGVGGSSLLSHIIVKQHPTVIIIVALLADY